MLTSTIDEGESTSVYIPKAEPGRDIFAEAPVKDIRSQDIPQPPVAPAADEEKLISSVIPDANVPKENYGGEEIVGEGKYFGQTAKDNNAEKKKAENEQVHIQTAPASPVPPASLDNEGMDPVIPPDAPIDGAGDQANKAEGMENGPLGEADAAAEQVAHELYPEDLD